MGWLLWHPIVTVVLSNNVDSALLSLTRHVPRPRPRPRLSVSVSSVSVCLGLACLGLDPGLGLGSLGPGLGSRSQSRFSQSRSRSRARSRPQPKTEWFHQKYFINITSTLAFLSVIFTSLYMMLLSI